MIKTNQVAVGVRVVLNSTFEINSLSDKYLACEPVLYIAQEKAYNDERGEYVFIRGGSHTNSGTAYLSQLDLEFPISDKPLYDYESVDYNKDLSKFKNNL